MITQTVQRVISERLRTELWEFYLARFRKTNRHTVQQHVMGQDTLADVTFDEFVTKYMVRRTSDNRLFGFSVMTNRIESWHWYSPDFFEENYPKEFAERRIFIIGFVAAIGREAFKELVAAMLPEINAVDGIAVLDYSDWHVEVTGLALTSEQIIRELNNTLETEVIGYQRYVLHRFAPKGSGGHG